MSENKEDPDYLAKRSILEAAGLDPDSDLVKQPLLVIIQEIQLIKAGIKPHPSSTIKATPPKESSAPRKDEVHSKTLEIDEKSASETVYTFEARIQGQYQALLTEILRLWGKYIEFQKSSLDQTCAFLNLQKYGLGEELSDYVQWATKTTTEGISATGLTQEMKKRTENLQKSLNTSLPASEKLSTEADELRKQIQRLFTMVESDYLKMDGLSKDMVAFFDKPGGKI